MRVFVTGATGFIGSAVVRELLDAGHQVIGLARSDASVAALTAAGASVHRGELNDLDSLRRGAIAADGVIHLAYIHDFSNIAAADEADLLAVKTIGAALEGSGKPFVNTSGMVADTPGRLATEVDAGPVGARRVDSEDGTLTLVACGVRSSVVRLPPSVHGEADKHGFIPLLIGIARAKGVSAFVGEGENRWPAVHQRDAARLYRLAVEAAPAGSRLHAVGDQGVPFREIAAAIGRRLQLPVVGIAAEQARDHFGFLGAIVSLDRPTSSALTQQRLGWRPEGPGLIADIDAGHYFSN